jgi:hypothetical protein
METMIVEREQALWLVARLLAEYDPDVKMEVIRSDGAIISSVLKRLTQSFCNGRRG